MHIITPSPSRNMTATYTGFQWTLHIVQECTAQDMMKLICSMIASLTTAQDGNSIRSPKQDGSWPGPPGSPQGEEDVGHQVDRLLPHFLIPGADHRVTLLCRLLAGHHSAWLLWPTPHLLVSRWPPVQSAAPPAQPVFSHAGLQLSLRQR